MVPEIRRPRRSSSGGASTQQDAAQRAVSGSGPPPIADQRRAPHRSFEVHATHSRRVEKACQGFAPCASSCRSTYSRIPPRRNPRVRAAAAACARREALTRSEEHTSELQSRLHLVCRLLLEKKK